MTSTFHTIGTILFAAASLVRIAHAGCVGLELAKFDDAAGAPLDGFGAAVAMAGNIAVIGAPGDDGLGSDAGAVHVFRRTAQGWTPDATLLAPEGSATDAFGTSVAADGDIVAVGAPQDDAGGINAGAVYIFRLAGDAWQFEAKLLPFDADALDGFGSSLAAGPDTIIAGAPGDDQHGGDAGAAYVFRYNGVAWTQDPKLTPPTAEPGDAFGAAVAIDGAAAVIGAPGDNVFGVDSGSAHAFTHDGVAWSHVALLAPFETDDDDAFGGSVAVFGDHLVVGASRSNLAGADSGAAFVYERLGPFWIESDLLLPADLAVGDRFGASVAMRDGHLVVGAPFADHAAANAGLAYAYSLEGETWLEIATLSASDAAINDEFGGSVAVDASGALAGAARDDDSGLNSGAAYVFAGLADCDGNGLPDLCDADLGTMDDCNGNGVPDACDIATGLLVDVDGNGIPDSCEAGGQTGGQGDGEIDADGNVHVEGDARPVRDHAGHRVTIVALGR